MKDFLPYLMVLLSIVAAVFLMKKAVGCLVKIIGLVLLTVVLAAAYYFYVQS